MSLFIRKNIAIATAGTWTLDVTTDGELSDQRSFDSITIQNYSPHNAEFFLNGRSYGTISAFNYQKFSGLQQYTISSFTIKNVGIATIDANKMVITIANLGTDAGISGMGSLISSEIDKTIAVSETAQPLMAAGDSQRFASFAEVSVSSMGALTPGMHKIYLGANLAKELLNRGSYYNFSQIGNQRYDLNSIYVKCDKPFTDIATDPSFETAAKWLFSANHGTAAVNNTGPRTGTNGGIMTVDGTLGAYAIIEAQTTNLVPVTAGQTYEWSCYHKTTNQGVGDSTRFQIHYYTAAKAALSYGPNQWAAASAYIYVKKTFSEVVPANGAYASIVAVIQGDSGLVNANWYIDDYTCTKTSWTDSEKPSVIVSGGC